VPLHLVDGSLFLQDSNNPILISLNIIALAAIHTGLNLTGPESFWRRWLLYAHLPVSTGMFVRALRDEGMLP
jgi:hypothetical protein